MVLGVWGIQTPLPQVLPESSAIGSHHLCRSPRGRGRQLDGLQFSTLNLSIQARRKQSSRDKGLSRGTDGLQPPATMEMPSLLSCYHADLVRAARGQGKVLGGLLLLWRGTGRTGAVAQASRTGVSCCRPLAVTAT